MKKLLITSATHSLGLRVTKLLEGKFEVLPATSEDLPSFIQAKYYKIPKGANPTFAHELLKLALDQDCAYILPLQLAEIESLAESLILFEEYGVQVICPSKSALQDLDVLPNPSKDLPLSLLYNTINMFDDKQVNLAVNGLGLLSDSELDFILAVAK